MLEISLYYFTLLYSHYSIIFYGVHEGSRRCLDAKKQLSEAVSRTPYKPIYGE
jgi:hypothetical protein